MAHLAAEVDDLSSAHETVAWELTQHKEEGKEKDLCIAELKDVLQQVTEEHNKLAVRESDLINQLELEREQYAMKATEAIDLNRHLKEVQVCVCENSLTVFMKYEMQQKSQATIKCELISM